MDILYTGDIESKIVVETSQWDFTLGVVFDGNKYNTFYDAVDMFKFMVGKTVYFHNLDFDFLFFLRLIELESQLENCRLITSGSKIIAVDMLGVKFRDSFALLPMSLKNIVKKFIEVNDSDYEDDKSNVVSLSGDKLLQYCKKDCLYLHQSIKLYWNLISPFLNELPLTTPSATFKIFIKHFVKDPQFLHVSSRNKFFDNDYYFGGHTEKFVNNRAVFRHSYYYDVNSLYPFILRDMVLPLGKLIMLKPSKTRLKNLIKAGTPFFTHLWIDVSSEELRFFPSRHDKRNRYLSGFQQVKMSEVGVKFVVEHGSWDSIIKVESIYASRSKQTIQPFTDYIDMFYKKRISGSSGEKILYKLFLNSLYGKFGERLTREVFVINDTLLGLPLSVKKFGNNLYLSKHIEVAKFYKTRLNRFDIAGKTTESARLYMGGIINKIRSMGFDVHYTDTDSIITNCCLEKYAPELLSSNKLGLLKNELGYGVSDSVYLLGCKFYHFRNHDKKASKGFYGMELNDFRSIIRKGKTTKVRNQFTKLSSLVSKGFFGIMKVPIELSTFIERLD